MRLSYSKLNTYRQCPLRYRFTYLDRLPSRPRRPFRAATRVHRALMAWLTYARQGSPEWSGVERAYRKAWDADGAPAGAELEETRDYQEGLALLREYHEANLERPCRPVLLEHKFLVPVGGHTLQGAMDRVDATDAGYEVIDYKLDRELRSQEQVDSDLQLSLYHLALERGEGLRPEALTLYFVRHNVRRTTTRTPAEIGDLARWVELTGNDLSAERRWTPCVGNHCSSCDFKPTCPAHTGAPMPAPAGLPVRRENQLQLRLDGFDLEPAVRPVAERQLALPLVP